jgi:Alpha-1,3-glucanase catalytic domain D1/Alpha-1,3-glucanase catalytic domain D2
MKTILRTAFRLVLGAVLASAGCSSEPDVQALQQPPNGGAGGSGGGASGAAGAGGSTSAGGAAGKAGSGGAAASAGVSGSPAGGNAGAGGIDASAGADVEVPDAKPGVIEAGDADASSTPPPASRGATLPYFEFEAEDAVTTGTVIAASRTFGDLAAESSGRRAVQLDATGQSVTFTLEHPTNSIVLRYAIPDAAGGEGIDATIGLYVDGVRTRSLELTSRYAWVYGGESSSDNNTPGAGAHHFFDEVHALIGDVPAGSTIALRKDAEDTAAWYVIDLVDFELVGPALARPAGSLSITDYGATADDDSDDAPAIQQAIDAGKAQNKVVFIPEGAFQCKTGPLRVSGVTLRGAGMWHSVLVGPFARIRVSGNDNRFYDFAIFGEVDSRNDAAPENAFDGPAGTGSRLENVWIEHQKCGWWVGLGDSGAASTPLTDGLVIHGARIRDTFADGVNLCNGTSNSVVEQSHFRNTGDDSIATWSPSFAGPPGSKNTFRFNTIQSPWRANCLAVYGGTDMTIEDNVCADPVLYPGILLATTGAFSPHPFSGTTTVQRNTLTRAGGPMYAQEHGALKIFGDALPIANVEVKDMLIEDSTFSAIHIQGPAAVTGLSFSGVQVKGAGTVGILVNANATGSATATDLVVSGVTPGLENDSSSWTFTKGAGCTGW